MVFRSTSRAFPGFDALFLIGNPWSNQAYLGTMPEDVGTESELWTWGELVPARPVVVEHFQGGSMPKDVVWTDSGPPVIVCRRVIDLLLQCEFTGWSTYPVEVYGKQGEPVEGYLGLSFTGRCGPIDHSRSVEVMVEYPGGIFPQAKGLYFDEESWDGSDLFMSSDGSGFEFAVAAVREAFRKAKVRNVKFERLDEVVLPWEVKK